MKILLYGGTFDPPHNGHMNNLAAAAACVQPDEVWVMPAGVPPHKAASATPAAQRLALCDCFYALAHTADIPSLIVSDWEIQQAEQGVTNYTVDTLAMLAQTYPEAQLYFCLGSDMLLSFTAWHRWQDILSCATMVVESRMCGDEADLRAAAAQLGTYREKILFARAPAVPMASHTLRAHLANGDDCRAYLPQGVHEKIVAHGLYRVQTGGET